MVEGRKKKREREKEEEEGLDRTYGSPCNRRLRRRARARGFRRSLCLCVSGVPEGASENEGSGRCCWCWWLASGGGGGGGGGTDEQAGKPAG